MGTHVPRTLGAQLKCVSRAAVARFQPLVTGRLSRARGPWKAVPYNYKAKMMRATEQGGQPERRAGAFA